MKLTLLPLALQLCALASQGAACYQAYYARDAEAWADDDYFEFDARGAPFTLLNDEGATFFARDNLPEWTTDHNSGAKVSDKANESMKTLAKDLAKRMPELSKQISDSVKRALASDTYSGMKVEEYQGVCDIAMQQLQEGSELHHTIERIGQRGDAKAFDFGVGMVHEWQLLVLESTALRRGLSRCGLLAAATKITLPINRDLKKLRDQLSKEFDERASVRQVMGPDPNLTKFAKDEGSFS